VTDGITRRRFIAASALASTALGNSALAAGAASETTATEIRKQPAGTWCRWLDGRAPAIATGTTWGMPWARGKHRANTQFALRDAQGRTLPVQSWPIAYWPDGSLKWTAHATPAGTQSESDLLEVVPGRSSPRPSTVLSAKQSDSFIEVDTGVIVCRVPRSGSTVIESIQRAGRPTLQAGRLVLVRQDTTVDDAEPGACGAALNLETFTGEVEQAELEHSGPLRAVIKITGRHGECGGRQWLPFTLRLYFHAGGENVRVMHTFVFDGDESRDFIRGIGLRFDAPLSDPMHDRHIRFAGEGGGVFAEAVRTLTGLRRDAGMKARKAQVAGLAAGTIAPVVEKSLDLVPAFGDWTLLQPNADSFQVRKRTAAGHGWLDSARGGRATGLGYVGGPSGGVAFGIRNFWQSHPTQLDIRGAASDRATVTLWLWAPDARPMDLRFYHDGLGQDTHDKQLEALNITYEDYEPGFGTALGVARTSEMSLWLLPSTPDRERFAELAQEASAPAVLVATAQTLHQAGVFGGTFSLPDRTDDHRARIEGRLDWLFDFYQKQREQHGWYGFWNYGDVMHTYDADRHVWRYDVGGYAWDNSELSTDIWLWLYFLRSGRADVFRFAEAMTRHTGEVDVHHVGRFAPLGSRHNVMHWGCSAKQLRISTALNRRYYYFLTADERVGDLLREQVEAARTLRTIVPERKLPGSRNLPKEDPHGDHARLSFGTDWGSIAGAWLTEWERTRSPVMRDRLAAGMRTIAAQPRGFFTGSGRMDLRTGAFDVARDPKVSVSHLSAAFGLPEVCAELIQLLAIPEFRRAWVQYCVLYNASPEQQRAELGESLGTLNLQQGHSRLTAYAAHAKRDEALARRAWDEFHAGGAGFAPDQRFETQRIAGHDVLNPVDEAAWVSTNSAAQWGLAAIECLAFASAGLP
jgi:hypothetical protein